MITPQPTAQYGQVLRVSVVREILSSRISALARERSNSPKPTDPPMAAVAFKKVRRRICIGASPLMVTVAEGVPLTHTCQEPVEGSLGGPMGVGGFGANSQLWE